MIAQNLKRSRGTAHEFARTYNSKSKIDHYLGGSLVPGPPDNGLTTAGLIMNGADPSFMMSLDQRRQTGNKSAMSSTRRNTTIEQVKLQNNPATVRVQSQPIPMPQSQQVSQSA
jgi:hypothetical protein